MNSNKFFSGLSILLFILIMVSCKTPERSLAVYDHGECFTATLDFDNSKNDTNRVRFIQSMVFDTSAIMVRGWIKDVNSFLPVPGADIMLFNKDQQIMSKTNEAGEFSIFRNIMGGTWNLYIEHQDYTCLYIADVVQTGGQVFTVKLRKKKLV